jgi:hypothetical protein
VESRVRSWINLCDIHAVQSDTAAGWSCFGFPLLTSFIKVSQAVLNILTEHDFQDAFRNGRSAGIGACALKGTTSRVFVTSRPKVSVDQMAVPVPEIMDYNLYTAADLSS